MTPEYKTLIEKLKNKTKAKEAIWNKSSRENEFILKLSEGSISTDLWLDEDENSFVDLRIWNNKGEIIDNVICAEENPDYLELQKLHQDVTRSYFKVEDTLQSFIKELDSKKIAGREEEDDLPF